MTNGWLAGEESFGQRNMQCREPIRGEMPIDPSYRLDKTIKTREQLDIAEAKNGLRPVGKYLGAKPSKKLAPFDLAWFQ